MPYPSSHAITTTAGPMYSVRRVTLWYSTTSRTCATTRIASSTPARPKESKPATSITAGSPPTKMPTTGTRLSAPSRTASGVGAGTSKARNSTHPINPTTSALRQHHVDVDLAARERLADHVGQPVASLLVGHLLQRSAREPWAPAEGEDHQDDGDQPRAAAADGLAGHLRRRLLEVVGDVLRLLRQLEVSGHPAEPVRLLDALRRLGDGLLEALDAGVEVLVDAAPDEPHAREQWDEHAEQREPAAHVPAQSGHHRFDRGRHHQCRDRPAERTPRRHEQVAGDQCDDDGTEDEDHRGRREAQARRRRPHPCVGIHGNVRY